MKKSKKGFGLVLFFLLLSACAVTPPIEEPTWQYVDSSIQVEKIKTKIAERLGVDSLTDINVSVYQGVAQLSGYVEDVYEMRQAVRAARSVLGTRAVINSLLIRTDMNYPRWTHFELLFGKMPYPWNNDFIY